MAGLTTRGQGQMSPKTRPGRVNEVLNAVGQG